MSATHTARLLLAVDLGAIWACLVLLLAAWRQLRSARTLAAVDAAAAVTSAWEPGWNAPTAPVSALAAVDPWAGAAAVQPPTALDLPAAQPGTWPPWAVPVPCLPQRETRRRPITRPRNDSPAAGQPRYVELVLTRRPGKKSPPGR